MDTVFLEEHLQPYIAYMQCIWQLFERYCVNFQFQLQGPIDEWPFFFYKKNNCRRVFFQIYYIFAEQELKQEDIKITNYDTSLGQKENYSRFQKCRWWKKIFSQVAANYFFNQFEWILLTERLPLWI